MWQWAFLLFRTLRCPWFNGRIPPSCGGEPGSIHGCIFEWLLVSFASLESVVNFVAETLCNITIFGWIPCHVVCRVQYRLWLVHLIAGWLIKQGKTYPSAELSGFNYDGVCACSVFAFSITRRNHVPICSRKWSLYCYNNVYCDK